MPTTYVAAEIDDPVRDVLKQQLARNHPDIGVAVDVLWHTKTDGNGMSMPMMCRGYSAAAKVRVVPVPQRAKGAGDAEITIDRPTWDGLTEQQRAALIDHELQHLEVCVDADGVTKRDCLGRPKVRLVPHDWHLEGFAEVVKRHKDAALEQQSLVRFITSKTGQMVMSFSPPDAPVQLTGEQVLAALPAALNLTGKVLERQDQLRELWGDKYAEKIAPYAAEIQDRVAATKEKPLVAGRKLAEQASTDVQASAYIVAAATMTKGTDTTKG